MALTNLGAGHGVLEVRRVGSQLTDFGPAMFATIGGTDGHDSIIGTGEGDLIESGAGRDTIRGRRGDDTIFSGQNDDRIFGARGNDFLYGDNGDDFIQGNSGDDTLGGVNGNDTLDGGGGGDLAFYTHFDRSDREGEGVNVDLNIQGVAQDTGGQGIDTLINIEHVLGSNVGDSITGNAGDNILIGNTGTDTINGGDGSDRIFADSTTENILNGGGGDDTVQGGGTVDGGDGNDLVVGQGSGSLASGGAGDDYVQGTFFVDTITGGDGNDQLVANGDNDTVDGGAGDDLVNASIAFDLIGLPGDGTYIGGEGNDTLSFFDTYFFGLDQGVKINLTKPVQESSVGTVTQSGFENLVGSAGPFGEPGGNDTLIGSEGDNSIYATWGSDLIRGAAGNDFLYGDHHLLPGVYVGLPQGTTFLGDGAINGLDTKGLYDDTIIGGQGNDTLWGSEGGDKLVGGNGNDVYMYGSLFDSTFDIPGDDGDAEPDRILGWLSFNDDGSVADRIDVSLIDADSGTDGDQAFTLVATFTGTAGEVVTAYDEENTRTLVKFDVDGDAVADMVIFVNGDHTEMTQDNFIA